MPRFVSDSKKKKLLSSITSPASARVVIEGARLPRWHQGVDRGGFAPALTIGLLAIADAAKARIDVKDPAKDIVKDHVVNGQNIFHEVKQSSPSHPLLHSAAMPEVGAGDGAEDADTPPADNEDVDSATQVEESNAATNDANDDITIIPDTPSSDSLLGDYLFDRPQSILTPYQLVSPYLGLAKNYYHRQDSITVKQPNHLLPDKQDAQFNISPSTISKSLQAMDYMMQQDIDKALFNETHPTANAVYDMGKDDNPSPTNPPADKDSKNEPVTDKLTEQKIELTDGSIKLEKTNGVVTNITLYGLVAWEDIAPWLHNNHDKLTIAPHGVLVITDISDFLSNLEHGLTLAGDGLVLLRDALTQFVLDGVALGILRDANINHRVFNNFFGDYYFIDLDTGDLLAPVDHSLLPPTMFPPTTPAPQLLMTDDKIVDSNLLADGVENMPPVIHDDLNTTIDVDAAAQQQTDHTSVMSENGQLFLAQIHQEHAKSDWLV